ncbi:hypothetical protein [Sphingomonas sp.]|uniref:hypothetical protein n=1 Tax=Sphingomonas sp. TaxID=28214 RepID=UPI0025CEB025|nr:hypothetical protein [Sphingomonas sp.]
MKRASPALVDLVLELHQLGAGDRKAILQRLEDEEKKLILAQLGRIKKRPETSFDALASLSPWLAESLAAARNGAPSLTPATREALLDAERLLPAEAGPKVPFSWRSKKRKAIA